ncbi:MAG: MBL fold metallo-hydrolase [Clostridiales bacterium]|nr:MBL fold metallo-hydrolase [Clostridiales bacterium]MDY3745938.1 MBL fold metallo-hydrolase [Lachnospiraceae bacterium]
MSEYYQPKYMGDGIYHIYEPGEVYTSLIIGTRQAMLIDTGYGFDDLKKTVEGLTKLPLIVVNTHGHFDHAGGNFQFENVYMHPGEREIYERYMKNVRPVAVGNFIRQDREKGTHVLPKTLDIEQYLEKPCQQTLPLENHRKFDLGGRTVEAIVLPGHTKHHVVFVDDKSGILFGGDDIAKNVWLQFDFSVPLHEYAHNLQAVSEYAGDVRILSSHSDMLYPKSLFTWLLTAIAHIDDSQSRTFIHPRTGEKSLLHTEYIKDEKMPEVKKVHIIYNKDNK